MNKYKEEILVKFAKKFGVKLAKADALLSEDNEHRLDMKIYNAIDKMLDTYAEKVLMSVLPKEKGWGDSHPHDDDLTFLNYTPCGIWNKCRQQTLDNFKKLKDE